MGIPIREQIRIRLEEIAILKERAEERGIKLKTDDNSMYEQGWKDANRRAHALISAFSDQPRTVAPTSETMQIALRENG